ncbi:hypothetical protein BU23DRAFT_560118 [Bimuria novae-zelandiae CBS 107.79]|uniref:Uncharacterized protein n=1 Tax=Bimuria novae-zelandiae CBS 107.79 TaxID=1447943 RepID=A0A6A5UNN5_9PLEO|nr:hypothetical protein BU23DRAFT_560118 [Bimuria novae-zelandiae CBS 107.79]
MGPILNLRILTTSIPHSLRALSIVSFAPAFILLLICGIASSRVNPAIGILPMFFSAAYSSALLANENNCGCRAAGLTGTPLHMVSDMLCGTGLLVCLILGWVSMGSWGYEGVPLIIGTYGTNFILFNFGVHAYFVLKDVFDAFQPGATYPNACRECQYMSFPRISVKFHSDDEHDGYKPLLDGEGRPTPAVNAEEAV